MWQLSSYTLASRLPNQTADVPILQCQPHIAAACSSASCISTSSCQELTQRPFIPEVTGCSREIEDPTVLMDPLTLTVSIAAIAGTVLQIQQYAKDVIGAKVDMNRLCSELLALKGVLEHVQYLLEPSKDGSATRQPGLNESVDDSNVFRSSQFKDIISDTITFLAYLQERLGKPKGPLHTAWNRFVWPSSKVEIGEHISRIERAKTYIVIVMLGDNIESSRSIFKEIKDFVARLDEEKIEGSKNALLRRLAPVNPTRAHSEACSARLTDTGLWLLRNVPFQTWNNASQGSTIWLCGKSGAGKTLMVSSVIEHTASLAVQNSGIGVAYFYCTFNDAASQEPLNILGSIIAQLARKQPSLLHHLESLFEQNEAKFANFTLSDLEKILQSCLASFDRVYIFIDAVNESGSAKNIIGSISRLARFSGKVFVLLTSIEVIHDSASKESFRSTVITLRPDDISAAVEIVIESSLRHRFNHLSINSALRKKIRTTLVGQADGMCVMPTRP